MSVPAKIEALPLRTFLAGDIVIQQGSPRENLYFLETGTVEVSKDGVSITRIRERGAMFGEMAVFLDTPYTATVSAVTDVTCRVVEAPDRFLEANADVVLYISRILAGRLESLNRYLLDVKAQFADRNDHLGMVDEVLDALMNRHPKKAPPPRKTGP